MVAFFKSILRFILVKIYISKNNTEYEVIRLKLEATESLLMYIFNKREMTLTAMHKVYEENITNSEFITSIRDLHESQIRLDKEITDFRLINKREGITNSSYYTIKHAWREVSLMLGNYPDNFPVLFKTRWFDTTPYLLRLMRLSEDIFKNTLTHLCNIIFVIIASIVVIIILPMPKFPPYQILFLLPGVLFALYGLYKSLPNLSKYDISKLTPTQQLEFLNLEGITANDKWLNSNTVTSTTNSTSN